MKADKKPVNKFKLLLVMLTAAALFIIVLLISAFGMLKLAQDYGLISVPGGNISLDTISEIDVGTMEMVTADYQEGSAIESIQMEYYMGD